MGLETLITLVGLTLSIAGGFAGVCYKLGQASHKIKVLEARVESLEEDCNEYNDVIIKVQTSLDFIVDSIKEMKTDIKEIRNNDVVQRENR